MTNAKSRAHRQQPPAETPAPTANATETENLWTLRKDGHIAEAHRRTIEQAGFELRYLHDGDVRFTQFYRDPGELQKAAETKRQELETKGWQV